jgi:hypothetical protein
VRSDLDVELTAAAYKTRESCLRADCKLMR